MRRYINVHIIIIFIYLSIIITIIIIIFIKYKRTKYTNISEDPNIPFAEHSVKLFTWELTSLGFVADPTDFVSHLGANLHPDSVYRQLVISVIGNSYNIYR